jgi:hypothetical protein
MKIYGDERVTDETASLSEMERKCYRFFKTPHGKREEFRVYRGFLIARATDIHACNAPVRRTSVYMYLPEGYGDDSPRPDLFCVSGCTTLNSFAQAQRYIDRLIEHGDYEYGWQEKVNQKA